MEAYITMISRVDVSEGDPACLSGERAPSSATLFKVLKAIGLQLSVHPLKAA